MNWKLILAIATSLAAADTPIQIAMLPDRMECPSLPKYEGCWIKTSRDLKPREVRCGTMPMRFLEEGAPEGPEHKRWRQCEEGRCSIDEETGMGSCYAIWCGRIPHWGI